VHGSVQSRWSDFSLWQAMKIEKKVGSGAIGPNDVVCLLSMNTGKHIDVESDAVQARWSECGDWRAMKIEKEETTALLSGSSIHLLAHTGNRLDVEAADARKME